MIDQRRLSLSDLVIGEPLPWDVYGAGDKLLLRRGHVLESQHQAEELVERGLFIDGAQAERVQVRKEPQESRAEAPSTLRVLNLSAKRLERLLYNLANESDVPAKVLEVGKAVAYAVGINSDVALACIQLNRTGGSYAVRHCIDTAVLALLVARAMRKDDAECQSIVAAALTMNIAMLRQHDRLQDKEDPLSDAERDLIRDHPHQGAAMLAEVGVDNPLWLECVRLHHENGDGSGYPAGACGVIPDAARIVALADRYCAAVSPRKYKKTLLPAAALRDVLMGTGKTAEPVLAAYFIKELGTTPPGTLVRLQDGEIGVVTQRPGVLPSPVVHAFVGPRGSPLSFPIKRDTGKPLHAIREALGSEQATLRFSMQQLWGAEAAP
jgi:HD-GYP domain-containing protein (c-di-GMP phosphodiesterase class II)